MNNLNRLSGSCTVDLYITEKESLILRLDGVLSSVTLDLNEFIVFRIGNVAEFHNFDRFLTFYIQISRFH